MKTFIKSMSWMVISGILIFTTTYISTGSIQASFWSAFSASLVKTFIYGIHEKAFERLWDSPNFDNACEYCGG